MASYRLGYVAQCLTLGVTASHTCRVATATPKVLNALIALNLSELEQILLFNERNGVRVFRIGSSIVPLATHPVNRNRWWQTFQRDFHRLGQIAARSGQRLSMHPGPEAASLSSMHPRVRRAAIKELEYSTRVLDLLGQDANARVVLHVGGASPDRSVAMSNAHRLVDRMPDDARRRIVIEHDDWIWTAREALPLATEHGLPFLADTLHNAVLPSGFTTAQLLREASKTWHSLGLRPKHHVATQKPGARKGAHSERISSASLVSVLNAMQDDADLMLEAKDKDLALFQLRSELQELGRPEGSMPAAPPGLLG